MYLTLMAEILLGLLSVYGLYMLFRSLRYCAPVRVLLSINESTTAAEVPFLLEQLWDTVPYGKLCIAALLNEKQYEDAELLRVLQGANVEIYIVKQ